MVKSCTIDGKQFCKVGDKPLNPVIAYPSGKRKLAKQIIKKSPKHKIYTEPFAGGAAVFFQKPLAQKNIINDKNKDLATFYKGVKESGFSKCDMTPSKEKFDRIKNKTNKTDCDVLFLNKWSFASAMKHYAPEKHELKTKDAGIKICSKKEGDYKQKLKNTTITNQDFKKTMEKHDSKDTFHYLDPPYVKGGQIYKEHKITPKEVCEVVKKMKGKVILSYDNSPEVRKACKGLKFKKIDHSYILNKQKTGGIKPVKELLITNY